MTEEKKTPAKKKAAAPKKTAAPKKATASKTVAPKAAKKKPSGKTVTVMQIRSPISRQKYQRDTLIGLGLNKIGRTRELEDTPSIRGMIDRVAHLVKVVEAA